MAKKPASLIPTKGPHTEAPKPAKPVSVVLTRQQADGLLGRKQEFDGIVAHAKDSFNAFLAGVLAGHGHSAGNVLSFDPQTRVLTFQPVPKPKAEG